MSSTLLGGVPLLPSRAKPVSGSFKNVGTAMDIENSKSGELLTKYLNEYGFGKFTIEAYNEFAEERLGLILKAFKKYYQNPDGIYAYTMELFEFRKPSETKEKAGIRIDPETARANLQSYTGRVICTLIKNKAVQVNGREVLYPVESAQVELCEIPVMIGSSKCHTVNMNDVEKLRSGECPSDPGGSFIIDGKSRILLLQEMLRRNTHFIHLNRHSTPYVSYLSDEINATNLIEVYISTQTRINSKEKKAPKETHRYRSRSGLILLYLGKLSTMTTLFGAFRIILEVHDPSMTKESLRAEMMKYILPFIPRSSKNKVLSFVESSIITALGVNVYDEFIRDYNEHKRDDDKMPANTPSATLATMIMSAIFPNYDISEPDFFMRNVGGQTHNYKLSAKFFHVGFFCVTVILAKLGLKKITNRDNWDEKSVRPPATTIEDKVRRLYNKVIATIVPTNDISNMALSLKDLGESIITQFLLRAFRSNSWSPKTQNRNVENISAILEYLNLNNYMAKLTEIAPPMDKRAKTLVRLRKDSEWGFIGLNDTPDGDTCGLTKHLATAAETSKCVIYNTRELQLLYAVYHAGIIPSYLSEEIDTPTRVPFFMNGRYMGFIPDGESAKQKIRAIKLDNFDYRHISVVIKDNILFLESGRDRPVRPVLRVGEDGVPLLIKDLGCACDLTQWDSCKTCKQGWRDLTFRQLVERKYIEYLDPAESDVYPDVLIATDVKDILTRRDEKDKLEKSIAKLHNEIKIATDLLLTKPTADPDLPNIHAGITSNKHLLTLFEANYENALRATRVTHMELHPSTFFSYAESTAPFPERNTAPRNMFYCSMTKQKVGVLSANVDNRLGGKVRSLVSGSRPLVETIIGDMMYRNLPSGNTFTIAIGTFRGLNQEDGLVMSERIAKRYDISGYVVQTEYSSVTASGEGYREEFGNPMLSPYNIYREDNFDMKRKFLGIDSNGRPKLDHYFTTGDCIIGKIRVVDNPKGGSTYEDASEYLDTTDEGKLVDVREGTKQSKAFLRIKLRETRRILPGEKFTTRQAQKTTVTSLRRDMPYSKLTGREVDIIMNPHCMSRMTIGLLIEILLGIPVDNRINGQAYEYVNIHKILAALPQYGYVEQDKTILIDPATGEEINCPIFVGPVYLELLKHHPYGKIQGLGPNVQGYGSNKRKVKPLTRAPGSGSRKSGIRFGDMERDAMNGYGAGNITRNILTQRTDSYDGKYCMSCSNFIRIREVTGAVCDVCGNTDRKRMGTHSRAFVLNTGNNQFLSAGLLNKPLFIVDS